MKNYYAILGIPRDATTLEIKQAYRKRALLIHPDKNSNASTFSEMSEINEAYSVLKDSELKGKYDASFAASQLEFENTVFNDHATYFDSQVFSNEWNESLSYRRTIILLWVLLFFLFALMAFFLYKTDPNILKTKSGIEENNIFPEDINPKEIREPSGVNEPVVREI